MSDDTPTQRFPEQPGQDATTQRLDAIEHEVEEEKRTSRGLMIGLIVAGALLLVAIIVLVVILWPRPAGDPQAVDTTTPVPSDSATPVVSDTPTPEPTETTAPPPPPAAQLTLDQFSVSPTTWTCNSSAPNPVPDPKLSFVWNTTNATHVYFAVGKVSDAQSMGQGWDLPEDGNQASFPDNSEFYFYCPAASQSYTLTAKDDQGRSVTKTVTVTNNGDTQ